MGDAFFVLVAAIAVFSFLYLATVVGRIARKVTEQYDLFSAVIAQVNNLDKKVKRTVELLDDIRSGRGSEADCHRMFSEAEGQKAALFQILKRGGDSAKAVRIASGLKKEVLRLYQDVIREFPDSKEAQIARERCEEIEKTAQNV
ncbi:MAG: hypothetical protein HY720_32825 [Planctomycetes bacterium]|nr:hypothetical protein [Planctomycetota bacterium]